ncbi:hypothetical protein MRX96_029271 [Rhipicephalus microplus]
MKAKKKPLEKKTPKDLGVDVGSRIDIVSVEDPPTREAWYQGGVCGRATREVEGPGAYLKMFGSTLRR